MASFHLSGGADGALRTREWRDSAVSGLSARAGTAEGRSPSPGVDAAPGQSLGPGASVSLEKRLVDVSRELGRERRRREGCERMLMAAEQRMARLAGAVEAQEAGSRAKIKRLREDVDILEEVVEEKTQELHASEREVERGQRSMQELQAELAKARWELLRARDSALESNRKQVDMLEAQNAQLRANADALEDEVSRLGSELAEARDDADAAKREVEDLRNDLQRVEEERDHLKGSSEAVEGTAAQNKELVRLVQSLRHELETAQKENAELKASLEGAERRARASMNAAADDAAEEYTQHRKTRRKLREWQERAEEAETQLAELRERHAHLQSTHVAKTRDLATRLDQAYSRHAAAQHAEEAARDRAHSLQRRAEEAESREDAIRQERNALQAKLTRVEQAWRASDALATQAFAAADFVASGAGSSGTPAPTSHTQAIVPRGQYAEASQHSVHDAVGAALSPYAARRHALAAAANAQWEEVEHARDRARQLESENRDLMEASAAREAELRRVEGLLRDMSDTTLRLVASHKEQDAQIAVAHRERDTLQSEADATRRRLARALDQASRSALALMRGESSEATMASTGASGFGDAARREGPGRGRGGAPPHIPLRLARLAARFRSQAAALVSACALLSVAGSVEPRGDAQRALVRACTEQQGTVGEAAASLAGDANGSGALRALREAVATTQGGLSVALRDCGITVDSLAPLMSSLQSSPPGSCPRWRLDLQGNALEDSALETILHAVADNRGSLEAVDLRGNALGRAAGQEAASFLETCDSLPVLDVSVRDGGVVVARLSSEDMAVPAEIVLDLREQAPASPRMTRATALEPLRERPPGQRDRLRDSRRAVEAEHSMGSERGMRQPRRRSLRSMRRDSNLPRLPSGAGARGMLWSRSHDSVISRYVPPEGECAAPTLAGGGQVSPRVLDEVREGSRCGREDLLAQGAREQLRSRDGYMAPGEGEGEDSASDTRAPSRESAQTPRYGVDDPRSTHDLAHGWTPQERARYGGFPRLPPTNRNGGRRTTVPQPASRKGLRDAPAASVLRR